VSQAQTCLRHQTSGSQPSSDTLRSRCSRESVLRRLGCGGFAPGCHPPRIFGGTTARLLLLRTSFHRRCCDSGNDPTIPDGASKSELGTSSSHGSCMAGGIPLAASWSNRALRSARCRRGPCRHRRSACRSPGGTQPLLLKSRPISFGTQQVIAGGHNERFGWMFAILARVERWLAATTR